MYNITIPENTSSNCFDNIYYSFLKYFEFDYKAYNIKYFYTDYYKISFNDITQCICRRTPNENILKDIYNIDVVFKDRNESDNLFEIICNSLNNRPVGIIIDPYYCYWSPFYKKSHYFHVIFIVNVDYHEKKYICFDVHFDSIGYVKVDFDIINKNFEQYFILNFKEVNEVKIEFLADKIKIVLDSFDNNLDTKKTELIDYFIMNDRRELFSENIKTSIPLINLMWISEDKKNFSIALRYIEDKLKKTVFSSVYELLLISQQNFLLLKSMLIKYAIAGVLKENNLKSIINEIFNTDEIIIEQMKNILKEIENK